MGGRDLRRQTLEVVYVSRTSREPRRRNMLLRVVPGFAWTDSWHFVTASIVGWVSLLAMIAMSIILQTYLSLAFLLLMPATGSVVCILYGITPRRLLINSASSFNRMVLVAENTNATNWTIFYGESTILNSLLNRLLEPQGLVIGPTLTAIFRKVLRILIASQPVGARTGRCRVQGLERILYILLGRLLHLRTRLRDPIQEGSQRLADIPRRPSHSALSDHAQLSEGASQHSPGAQPRHVFSAPRRSARRPNQA